MKRTRSVIDWCHWRKEEATTLSCGGVSFRVRHQRGEPPLIDDTSPDQIDLFIAEVNREIEKIISEEIEKARFEGWLQGAKSWRDAVLADEDDE